MTWVLCELTEMVQDEDVEPDWSRVPEFKRDEIRGRWIAKHSQEVTSRVLLWSGQIAFFSRQYTVRPVLVEEPVVDPENPREDWPYADEPPE